MGERVDKDGTEITDLKNLPKFTAPATLSYII